VRGSTKGIRVVNFKQMEVKVQYQRPGILCVYFKLCHSLYISTFNVKELKVHHSLKQVEIDTCLLFSQLYHNANRFTRPLTSSFVDILKYLFPPSKPRLTYTDLLRNLAWLHGFQEQSMDAIVVRLRTLGHVLSISISVKVKLFYLSCTMFDGII